MTPELIEELFDDFLESDLIEHGSAFQGAADFKDFLIEYLTENKV